MSLLFAFMDEFLFKFSSDYIIFKEVKIIEFDETNFKIKAIGYLFTFLSFFFLFLFFELKTQNHRKGEPWDMSKHPQGTEVKGDSYFLSYLQNYFSFIKCHINMIIQHSFFLFLPKKFSSYHLF